jgi:hypothetical protein
MAPGTIVSETERVVVLVAAKAVTRFYESGILLIDSDKDEADCKLMLHDFWRFFVLRLPSDVQEEVADISQKIYRRFGSSETDNFDIVSEVDEDDTHDDDDGEWNTRKSCVRIVNSFFLALTDIAFNHGRFLCDYCDDDGDQYYPRALWHAFFRNLNKTVRQAAFSVHENYIREFVHDRNVSEFETFKIPAGALFFADELSRSSLRSNATKRFFESGDDDVAPAPKSYRAEGEVASAAHDALAEMVNNGSVVASTPSHKLGVIGQWWDAFMQRLVLRGGPQVANGIASASEVAYNFFRSQVQEQ